jgi:hypothetical protein
MISQVPGTKYQVPLLVLGLLVGVTGCQDTFYPLKNRITPGLDPFVVFAAEGQAGSRELWAAHTGGGRAYQLSYTLGDESAPALSPTGGVLAFLRSTGRADSAGRRIWFMNLSTGAERDLPVFPDSSIPSRLAFSSDGATLYARTPSGLWALPTPPSAYAPEHLSGADSLAADSALTVFIGDPPFARIAPCEERLGWICAFPPGKAEAPLQEGGVDPVRWGPDSVGYLVGDRLVVRSGGAGRSREVMWTGVPPHPESPTYAPAAPLP